MNVLTVATLSHVPQALGMLARMRDIDPSVAIHLFIVDAEPEARAGLSSIFAGEWSWLHWFIPADLSLHRDAFLTAAEYYSGIEICCLAKYVGLAHVLSTASVPVAFLDTDILVTRSLDRALSELGDRPFLLTPHALGPGDPAMEHEYLLHGWVNAGFMLVRPGERALTILNWLVERISRRGFLAPEYGMSCDQTWVSALPVAFLDDVKLSKDPGLNVAYWNIHERALVRSGSGFTASGEPLTFFHFSGFRADRPDVLSLHHPLPVEPGSVMEQLSRLYLAQTRMAGALSEPLAVLPRRSTSEAPLRARLAAGALRHGINFRSPSVAPGWLSRVATRLEATLSRRRR